MLLLIKVSFLNYQNRAIISYRLPLDMWGLHKSQTKYCIPFLYLVLNLISFLQVHKMADETGLDFSDQIGALERKYEQVTFKSA